MPNDIVTREQWLEARRAHLEDEKALTRARDALAARRRALPWVRIEKDYALTGTGGPVTLDGLFGPHSQLIVYHFMFGPDWEEGCTSCSCWGDNFDGLPIHLAHRDVAFAAVSNTAFEKLDAYRKRMGWSFPWVSSLGSNFNRDFDVSFGAEELAAGPVRYNYAETRFPVTEAPGLSVFHKPGDGSIVHTYSTYARGLEPLLGPYHYLDLVPKGRDEEGLDFTMAWLRRRDQYDD